MFLVVGDIHNLALEMLADIIDKERPCFVLQTGDFGLYDEQTDIENLIPPKYRFEAEVLNFPRIRDGKIALNAPVYFVLGNHDDKTMLLKYPELKEKGFKNLKLLDENPVDLKGYKICGLSGNYGRKSFEKNNRRKPNHILREDMGKFTQPFDILVMHDSPHPEFAPPLFDFIMNHKPKIVFHGHIHNKKVSDVEGVKIISLPLLSTGEYIRVNDDLSWEWRKYNPGILVKIVLYFFNGIEIIINKIKALYSRSLDARFMTKQGKIVQEQARKAGYKIPFREIMRALYKASDKILEELKKRNLSEEEKGKIWEDVLNSELKLEERAATGRLKRVSSRTFMKSLGGEFDDNEVEEIAGYKELTPAQTDILLRALEEDECLNDALDIVDNLGEGQYQSKMTKVIRGGENKREAILIKVLKALGGYGDVEILKKLKELKKKESDEEIVPWYDYAIEKIQQRLKR